MNRSCWITNFTLLASAVLIRVSSQTSTAIDRCGSVYTLPRELTWLTNNANDCSGDAPCQYTIMAPQGAAVRLNFTSLSGLEYSESNTHTNVYDLIEGESSCEPRIEVTESYHEEDNVQVTRRKTLCYDRIFGSSVVIETRSRLVNLSIYCLARKYSFFSMNFSFITQPATCSSLQCNGKCLRASQVCDGIQDCKSGEDEMSCDDALSDLGQHDMINQEGKLKDSLIVIVVLSMVAILTLVVVTTVCLCQRKHISQSTSSSEQAPKLSLSWRSKTNRAMPDSPPVTQTQHLLHQPASSLSPSLPQNPGQQRHTSNVNQAAGVSNAASPINLSATFPICNIINSLDSEYSYEYDKQELLKSQEIGRRLAEFLGNQLPPNVNLTVNEDGVQQYPVQKAWHPRCSTSYPIAERAEDEEDQGPPPYSQANSCYRGSQLHRLQTTCSQQQACAGLRRESCTSYSSHKSEPPSYEAATNCIAAAAVAISPFTGQPYAALDTSSNCPLCQQTL